MLFPLYVSNVLAPKGLEIECTFTYYGGVRKKYKACFIETQGVPHGIKSPCAANKERNLIGSWCNHLSLERNSEDSQWRVMNTFSRFRFMYIILYGIWCVNMARKRQPSTYFQRINYITIRPCFSRPWYIPIEDINILKRGHPLTKVQGPNLLMNINSF